MMPVNQCKPSLVFTHLDELVADDFLFAPLLADLVDEDDVVRLTDGQLGAVRRKLDGLKQLIKVGFPNGKSLQNRSKQSSKLIIFS